jgi:hypothetical protein
VLLAVLVASTTLASEREKLVVRTLLLSEHPDNPTDYVYVKGQIVTVLRFEQPVNAAMTKMLSWEGRLEPLGVVGNKVILEPLRDLARSEEAWTDQQVDVFENRESYKAMFSALMRAQKCPEEARKAMNYLRMFVGEGAVVQIDANQSSSPITLYDGPIESQLRDDLGLLEAPGRLYGRVWTSGPQAVIRYYEAQPVRGGDKVPLCAVARLGLGQFRKRPESKPGTAILDSHTAAVFIVDEFR